MLGMVGMVRADGVPASAAAVARRLCRLPSHACEEVSPTPGLSLGAIYRNSRFPEWDWHFDPASCRGALIAGAMHTDLPSPHLVTAAELVARHRVQGFQRWEDFEGPFVAAVVDLTRNVLSVANDRLGLVPLYYGSRPGRFVFAPEAKGVFLEPPTTAALSPAGIVSYLTAGYCIGDLSLFEGVQALEPCTLLSVHLDTLRVTTSRLWKMVYEPARELRSRPAGEEALARTIVSAHQDLVRHTASGITVMLSGGWDSRGMLAALDRIGCTSVRVESRGARDDIPGSDVALARQLAEQFNVPFAFRRTTTDAFLEHGEQWCYMSELVNCGWYSEIGEASRLSEAADDLVLVGDEGFGWMGDVRNETDAVAAVLPPRVPPALRAMLNPAFAGAADDLHRAAVQSLARTCENTDYVDRKDFMYLHGRLARFIFPLRRYKELTAPVRRPLLSNGVLEVIRRLPPQHRLFKNLYLSTLQHHFPRAMSVPATTAASHPDWSSDARANRALRRHLLDVLSFDRLERGPLGHILDRSAFERIRDDFFSGGRRSVPRHSSRLGRHKRTIERVMSRSRLLSRVLDVVRKPARLHAVSPFSLLHRTALLSLLQGHLD